MTKILIVYATGCGCTKKMAEAVAAGVNAVGGSQATVKTAEEATVDDVAAAIKGTELFAE
jgi:flavodoxin